MPLVPIMVIAAGGTLGQITFTNGTANFSITLNTAGTQTVTVTETVTASITETTSDITVS